MVVYLVEKCDSDSNTVIAAFTHLNNALEFSKEMSSNLGKGYSCDVSEVVLDSPNQAIKNIAYSLNGTMRLL